MERFESATAAVKTLLVSDLVDSTRLVAELGDRRAAAVFARLDRVARDLMAEHRGTEIDKTDGFLVLFDRPAEAVRYALAYHQALAALSGELGLRLAARVGVHRGPVVMRRNPPADVARGAKPLEVEGLAKPKTARLTSLARGGQTLLTRHAYEPAHRALAGSELADELEWTAYGRYRFKGLDEPVCVFEVGRPGSAPFSAPRGSSKARKVRRWQPALLAAAVIAVLLGLRPAPTSLAAEGPTDARSSTRAVAEGSSAPEDPPGDGEEVPTFEPTAVEEPSERPMHVSNGLPLSARHAPNGETLDKFVEEAPSIALRLAFRDGAGQWDDHGDLKEPRALHPASPSAATQFTARGPLTAAPAPMWQPPAGARRSR